MRHFPPLARLMCWVVVLGVVSAASVRAASADRSAKAPPPRLIDGVVASAYDVTLAFSTSGVVRNVAVQPGAIVKAGQTLAAFDNEEQKARLTLTKMQLEQSRDTLAKVEQQAKTVAAYVKAGRQTQSDADAAQASLRQRQVLSAQAQLAYQLAQRRYEQRTLKAPVDGMAVRVLIAKGQYVAAGQPVLRLVQPDHLYIQADIPTQLAATLKVGDAVRATPRGDDRVKPVTGRIAYLAQVVDTPTDTRRARIELTGDMPRELLIGSYVTVELSPRQ